MSNISKFVKNEKEANRILQIAVTGLLQESSSVIYNSLGSILNLSNLSFITVTDTIFCNLLCVLDDCLTQNIHFPMLVCRILNKLLVKYDIDHDKKSTLDQSTVINMVSILQDVTDEESSNEILSQIINKSLKTDCKQIMFDWANTVVPLARQILSVLGKYF